MKIFVLGGNGSGKTTFSIVLAGKLNLPLIHLDKLGWKGNWQMTPRDEFDTLLAEELKKPQAGAEIVEEIDDITSETFLTFLSS